MRVLFILSQPFLSDRGTPLRALRQLQVLSRMGHRVDLLCYPFGEDVALPGLRIIRIRRPPGIRDVRVGPSAAKFPLDFLMLCRAVGLCLCARYDVIQATEEGAFFAAWLARLFGGRLVYNMESQVSDQLRYSGFCRFRSLLKLVEFLEVAAMRRAAYVVTVGSVLSDVVRSFAPGAKIVQLEDAPAADRFEEDPEGAARLRRELGLGDAAVAVYTGNFAPYQGVELLMRAAAAVAAKMPEARIVLAGGAAADVARMRELAGSAGAGSICRFAGQRPASEMRAFMTLATAFLSPRTEGANPPMKIYPYMQSGRVLVATRLPTHTQVLDDTCAILTEPTPVDLAAGIVRALQDGEPAERLAQAAKARVQARYSLAIFRGKVQAMYEALQ